MMCGCEHGMKCSKVSVCFMEDRVAEEKHDLEATIADLRERHEAFVRTVREIAERAVIRHADGLGEASGTIAIIAALCDAELGKEQP